MFDQIHRSGLFPTLDTDTAVHVFQLNLHHHRVVRFWARKLIEKFIGTDDYKLPDTDFPQIAGLVIAMLQSLTTPTHSTDYCPFEVTQDKGEFWKTLRLAATAMSSDRLHQCLLDARISMPVIIQTQLTSSSERLVDILKAMTAMLLKLQSRFWGTIETDATLYCNIIKQICEHAAFQSVMKIARDGNIGKILQKDGTRYPEDKLMAKIKSILEWMYPYWSSLRRSSVEAQMTERMLDTTFGYFQMEIWGVMSRAYCAELGLQIVDQCLLDDNLPKLDQYIPQIISFAKIDASTLPAIVQDMPNVAVNLLGDLADKYTTSVMYAFRYIFPSIIEEGENVGSLAKNTHYDNIWNALTTNFEESSPSTLFINVFLKAYANIATVDLPDLEKQAQKSPFPTEVAYVTRKLSDVRSFVIQLLPKVQHMDWNTRKKMITDTEMIKPILHLWCSQYPELRDRTIQFVQPNKSYNVDPFYEFFMLNPSKVTEAINFIIQEYMVLLTSNIDIFRSLPSFTLVLKLYIESLTSKGYLESLLGKGTEEDESGQFRVFWDSCWKVNQLILEACLKWSEFYKPREVVDIVIPVLDIAGQMMEAHLLFKKVVLPDTLSYSFICTSVGSLSHWVYVTRQDVISRLLPLIVNMLDTLKLKDMKISVEAYDRLMTASTGVNVSKLTIAEKEKLSLALRAHEPDNFIFFNDSDDEEVEWQSITTPNRADYTKITASERTTPERITPFSLDESFANMVTTTPPRLQSTTYISQNKEQGILKDEFENECGDIDMLQIDESWFDDEIESVNETPSVEPMDLDTSNITTQKEVFKEKAVTEAPKRYQNRVYVPETQQQTYAVTSTGRKLKPPPMGFSKVKSLKDEFRAEQRLMATVKSPSAASVVHKGYAQDNSSSESSDDDEEGGLQDLVNDMDDRAANTETVKALFNTKPKRTIKLVDTNITKKYIQQKEQRLKNRRQKIIPNIDRLFKAILSWDISLSRDMPPAMDETIYKCIPTKFQTFQDYKNTFEPLLVTEIWSQIQRAKESLSQSDVLEQCIVAGRRHTNDFVDIMFNWPMSLVTNYVSVDDLVCISNHFGSVFFNDPSSLTEEGEVTKPWRERAFLGKVASINQTKNMGEVTIRCYFTPNRIGVLNSISPKTSWSILRIMSLTTAMREYAALEALEHYELGPEILNPAPTAIAKPGALIIQQYCKNYNVNEPQAEAIATAIQKRKGFSLIQGPPGTGKTKTILALIVSLLDQRHKSTPGQPYGGSKLLVCAPSNAAVDEITKRLKEGVMTSHGLRKPNVVRIGVSDSVNASVKDRILDRLIEAEMDANVGSDDTITKIGSRLDGIHNDIRNIQIGMDEVDREITQAGSDIVQMSILRGKRKALAQKLAKARIALRDAHQDQKNYGQEMEISRIRARQKVFTNADVVCATLSGSGHDMMTAMGASFETVIVDEASQSVEISSLIPLKFDTQRCILVGDPNQLPPTVMSTLATKYDYQQSLFMRLEKTIGKEVNLLNIQYRMHPEISDLPSRLFYQSRLQDGSEMDKISSAVWHALPEFPPYCFYDVRDGQEKMGRGKSIFNVAEADAAVSLVDLLLTKLPTMKFASKIGVITPYKQQVGQLKARFQKRFGDGIVDAIDFNTVDGFQGQEKEIIIFSCVRAGSGRGIGFLADMRRMNVGLTRAKCSLYVLGHANSLSRSEYWGDLVQDAKKRSLMRECGYPYFKHHMSESIIPQNIYEKDIVTMPSTESIEDIKGPTKIDEPPAEPPGSPRIGKKRQQSPQLENIRPTRAKISLEDSLFMRNPNKKTSSLRELQSAREIIPNEPDDKIDNLFINNRNSNINNIKEF
ncbi:hypothetical protein G6F16_005643 [Rhizopus arrhizus]|nr:hypothetical protein G6F24_006691 [Rhizopus arrhizus]KAG0794116.1 hypothetical protein G6F21_003111 [Rhizopus arrhizus]KAG0800328.1 hypothetical protein G6F22_002340 [Rhizopus arrhizus]KAG0815333.1 hypothetical protein G6F20_004074 [Rhizopus arrhizus]KAG0836481.1 hypothetical protein G6F19_004214 [Rhizopus arrhizus]